MNAETPQYHCRALCVDVSESMSKVLRLILEPMGVEVIWVATILEAQHLLDTDGPFMILTPCIYGANGDILDWGRDVRRDHPDMVMIARSGYVPNGLPEQAIQAGFDHFLEMPFPLELFHDAVRTSLQAHGHGDIVKHLNRVTFQKQSPDGNPE